MTGMHAIIRRYHLTAQQGQEDGLFQWKRRMGIHMAFHQNPVNIGIHALFSVVNAWAILLIAYPFSLFDFFPWVGTINMAIIVLALTFLIYSCLDIAAAIFSTALYAATYPLCQPLFELVGNSSLAMIFLGAALTLIALAIQVYIGHGIAERGIDDATDNFSEMFARKNPLFIALLPFYTYLDLLFRLGYRPKLASYIDSITAELRPKLEAEIRQ